MNQTQTSSKTPKRRRLPVEVRMEQILDAALAEFSQHGFVSARMADIAQRAELSKSGLYAHFKNKEAIFEALLDERLSPTFAPDAWCFSDMNALHASIESFVTHLYCRLEEPGFVATLRLMITESNRMPHVIRYWYDHISRTYLSEQQAKLDEAVANGQLCRSALTDDVSLLFAPLLQAMLRRMILPETVPQDIQSLRRAHVAMLRELLHHPDQGANPR